MPVDANVKELFLALLEMPADERATYLDTACAGDPARRDQIEAMLRCHANSGELLVRSPAEMLKDSATDAAVSGADAPRADPAATLPDSAQVQANEFPYLTPSEKPGQLGRLGPYEVEKVLGRGGFGVVLKAFDERLHRVVAIKVLSPAYAAIGSARTRFSREARAAAAVRNEQVVGIHDVQGDADPPYLVMEYIDGPSLQHKIDRHGPLALTEILRIGMQIAEGLAAAHKQGLVHRDIKPANILLENGVERVKITDFGLARAVDDASVTQSGTVAGTPMYMSPEQADGLPIDHRSDLFSLGTVLYAMCTGHPPFRASSTHAVLKRVIDASPRPIRETNNEVPEWLCGIIAKLHAKKPEERFQTARDVAELFGQHLAHLQQPSQTPRPAPTAVPAAIGPGPHDTAQSEFASPPGATVILWPILICLLLGAVVGFVLALTTPYLSLWGAETSLGLGVAYSAWVGTWVGSAAGLMRWAVSWRIWWEIRKARETGGTSPAANPSLPAARRRRWLVATTFLLVGGVAVAVAVWWLRTMHPATLVLTFLHPTAVVVVEGKNLDKREYRVEKPGHSKTIADLDAGKYRLSVVLDGQEVESEEIALVAGKRYERMIKPIGRIQVINASDLDISFHGPAAIDPKTRVPSVEHVGPGSAYIDDTLAGPHQWYWSGANGDLGKAAGEFYVIPGKTYVLRVPEKRDAIEDWVQLFNGKDLDGWTNPKKVFDSWRVEKGVLIGTGENAFLRNERGPFADFHLRMEAKYVGGTAGLVLREQSLEVAGAGYVCSMENNKDGEFNTGAVALMPTKNMMGAFAVPKQVLTQEGKWFTLEVIANGNRIQTLVDDKKGANFVDIHHDFKEGFIALTVRGHEGELHVKKIEIKELPPEERGWIQLFNGTDLNGWSNPRFDAKWKVVDGVLTGSAKPHKNGMLPVLGTPLTNFHLKAQARISQEGSAGVLFRSTRDSAYLVEFGGGKAGSLFQLSPNKCLVDKGHAVAPGQWFALDVIADGKRVTTKIDGQVVADFADARVAPGQIELEVDAGPAGSPATVAFRSIEVKEFPGPHANKALATVP